MKPTFHQMVITDLDGTLLRDDKTVSPLDQQTLQALTNHRVARVAATGRSLHDARAVLPPSFPIDYLVFSSGAGVVHWPSQRILFSAHLPQGQVQFIYELLMAHALSFAIHRPIPDNHLFYVKRGKHTTPDFEKRCQRHQGKYEYLRDGYPNKQASQFLVTFRDLDSFNHIASRLHNVGIIRATSPVDFQTLWMEIFAKDVSKGHTCQWLCQQLGISTKATFAIGNDYNDLQMLQWAQKAYVVNNAPQELKQQFTLSTSNMESGFSHAVRLAGIGSSS